jgi:hypothetical protein
MCCFLSTEGPKKRNLIDSCYVTFPITMLEKLGAKLNGPDY